MNDIIYANSLISAYMAKYMLDQTHIQSMVRAKDFQTAAAMLTQCDYRVIIGTIDEIIEAARADAFEMFEKYCPDNAVVSCIKAIFDFKTTVLSDKILKDAEKELAEKINANIKSIKYEKIRLWLQTYINAIDGKAKIPSNQLFNMAYEMRTDVDQGGLIFYWYILKQSELVAVKTILLGQQFNLEREKIMDNLRWIYGRFS